MMLNVFVVLGTLFAVLVLSAIAAKSLKVVEIDEKELEIAEKEVSSEDK